MTKFTRTRILVSFFIFLFVGISGATDLKPVKLATNPPAPRVGDNLTLTVTVANINMLDAEDFSVRLRIFTVNGDTTSGVIYNEKLTGLFLPKYSTKDFSFPVKFNGNFAGRYRFVAEVAYLYDIDASNNRLDSSFNVLIKDGLNHDKAEVIIIDNLRMFSPLPDSTRASLAVLPTYFPAGTKIKSRDSTELNITLTSPTWIGWYRENKFALYSSNNGVFLLEDDDSIPTFHPTKFWVKVNDTSITELVADSLYSFGSGPRVLLLDTLTISSSTQQTDTIDECAILVSGEGSNAREQWAFNFDVDAMDANLRIEALGPHLKPQNIFKMYAPSDTEILAKINSLKGKCKKIWFYYGGHGGSATNTVTGKPYGYMATRGGLFLYSTLYDALFATDAQLTVMIDGCYSGVAVEQIRDDPRVEDHDLNVITSCQAGETCLIFFTGENNQIGFSGFTLFWLKCFGAAEAEYDGVPGISEQEATDWLRSENPELPNGKRMKEEFHPRALHHSMVRGIPQNVPTPVGQTSVTATLNSGGEKGVGLSVTMYDPSVPYVYGTPKELSDSAINSLSYGRLWDIKYPVSTGMKYSFGLDFRITPGDDSLPPSMTPGILHREDSLQPWSVYTPFVYIPGTKTIRAFGVNRFSQWLLATVQKPQAGVHTSEVVLSTDVYPNPAMSAASLHMVLDKDGEIEGAILDETGKKRFVIAKGFFPAGDYRLPFSVSSFESGTYFFQLSRAGISNIPVTKFVVRH